MTVEFDFKPSTGKLSVKIDDPNAFSQLREHFSVENEGAHFARRRGRFIPRRKYIITPTGACDLGIYWEIRKFLVEKQIICDVIITNTLQNVIEPRNDFKYYSDFKFQLREYQEDVLKRAIKIGRGTCILGTGAGKTFTTAALIQNYYENCNNKQTFKCLLIVPDLGLVEQTYNEFLNCGITFTCSKWTGKQDPDIVSNVVICNLGVLQSRFDTSEWVKYVDLLIVDECHKIRQKSVISKIITKIKTLHRYGFTGTLPEEQIDIWNITGKIGPVIYEKSSADLRQEEFLVDVEVKVVQLEYLTTPPRKTKNNYRNEIEFLFENEFRNNFIKRLCDKLNNNTLILVNQISHGVILEDVLSSLESKDVYFIRGEVDIEAREKVKQLMETNNNIVCIAISAIFSTGVNIKNLHNIIFASGGKSFVRTVQSIGRGLRKHINKSKLVVFDLADSFKYGIRHSLKRCEIYEKEKIKYTTIIIKET